MVLTSSSYEIEITSEVTGRAPTPELTIGVKQSGKKQRNSHQLLMILNFLPKMIYLLTFSLTL